MLVEKRSPGCLSSLLVWLASASAVWLTAELLPGVTVDSFATALWVAVVLGFLNALVRPLLIVLTLPVTVLTLGLFLIVVNAAVLGLGAWMLSGFAIASFGWAMLAAIVLTLVSGVLSRMLEGGRQTDDD